MKKSIGSFVVLNRRAVLLLGVVLSLTVFGVATWRTGAHNRTGNRPTVPLPQTVWAGWLFVAGTVLFCGSLYILAMTGIRWWGAVTPLGGVAFLAGWLCLTLSARYR